MRRTLVALALCCWMVCSLVMVVSFVGILGMLVMEESDYKWMDIPKQLILALNTYSP